MPRQHLVITGGAGFIGTNAVLYFSRRNWDVTVLDNLSRAGADSNLAWLRTRRNFAFAEIDIRDDKALQAFFAAQSSVDAVIHLAAQVAVTTSVIDPRTDFDINALGTLNVLEAVRAHHPGAFLINASTNKVYGKLDHIPVEQIDGRWAYADHEGGVGESEPLDFHSPYGCSKGAAERYVADYCRIYGMRTVSFRQSCIYGPHQFGIEDQGWLAWFAIAAMLGKPITIYGDGRQVRDVLFVDDLLAAYEAAIAGADQISGDAFNIGGGPSNTISLLELIDMINDYTGRKIEFGFDDERPGDQKVFISDVGRLDAKLDWRPSVDVPSGVGRLLDWIAQNRDLFDGLHN